MSLPAAARNRWGLEDGGRLGYVDLGDAVLFVPGGIEAVRSELLNAITPDMWEHAADGHGDPEIANQ